jgi:hypothetical protein
VYYAVYVVNNTLLRKCIGLDRAVTFSTYILKVSGSNTGLDTDNPDVHFCDKFTDSILNYIMTASFQIKVCGSRYVYRRLATDVVGTASLNIL